MGDESAASLVITGASKKRKDDKHRRRDPRSWENIKKATLTMSQEERDAYLAKIYNEMYNENRTLSTNLQAREKQLQVVQKESDHNRSELTKSILARGQLESLCRELQKQNKLIKEENVARIKEEEDRRREVANTFTERLNALTNLITESKDKSNKVKEENQNMTEKLTELYDQYQQRENHLETVTKQLDLQIKLAETQAKKTEIEHEAERQTCLAEKKALVMQLEQYEREIVLLQEKNRSLEAQVDLYKSQYSDFESTMMKSNKVFDTFKEEMSRMNKQLHVLELERNDLKKKWQSSVNSLIVLSEQHVALSNEQSTLEKRLAMLQKLSRQLQEERSAYLKQLKENNIEPIVPVIKNDSDICENAAESNSESSKSTQPTPQLTQGRGKLPTVPVANMDKEKPSGSKDHGKSGQGLKREPKENVPPNEATPIDKGSIEEKPRASESYMNPETSEEVFLPLPRSISPFTPSYSSDRSYGNLDSNDSANVFASVTPSCSPVPSYDSNDSTSSEVFIRSVILTDTPRTPKAVTPTRGESSPSGSVTPTPFSPKSDNAGSDASPGSASSESTVIGFPTRPVEYSRYSGFNPTSLYGEVAPISPFTHGEGQLPNTPTPVPSPSKRDEAGPSTSRSPDGADEGEGSDDVINVVPYHAFK